MKHFDADESGLGIPMVELTERNLRTLLDKLTDPDSARTLVDGEYRVAVRAVPDEAHYANRPPGAVWTHGKEWS